MLLVSSLLSPTCGITHQRPSWLCQSLANI